MLTNYIVVAVFFVAALLRLVPPEGGTWLEGTPLLLGGVSGLQAPTKYVVSSKSQAKVVRSTMRVNFCVSNGASAANREQRGAQAAEGFLKAVISKMKSNNLILIDHFMGVAPWLVGVARLARTTDIPSDFKLRALALEHRDHCFAVGRVRVLRDLADAYLNGRFRLPGRPVPVSYTHLTLPTKA